MSLRNLKITLVALLAIPWVGCEPAQELAPGPNRDVIVSVEQGREIMVGDSLHTAGIHTRRNAARPVPRIPGNVGVRIGPAEGPIRNMASEDLKSVHVHATNIQFRLPPSVVGGLTVPDSVAGPGSKLTIVYGAYDDMPSAAGFTSLSSMVSRGVPENWECIWCQGEVLVCGVNPQCQGGGRPD